MKHITLLLLILGFSLEAKNSKPNVILLMGDDHGWEEVGYNGHPYVKTPNLDDMASAGLRLDNFYAQPTCSHTRGSVLTGRHPNRSGQVSERAWLCRGRTDTGDAEDEGEAG
tara:strand:- start:32 stop:367 length:336 start_codon:yes stop_codon:yes gene_type:complete